MSPFWTLFKKGFLELKGAHVNYAHDSKGVAFKSGAYPPPPPHHTHIRYTRKRYPEPQIYWDARVWKLEDPYLPSYKGTKVVCFSEDWIPHIETQEGERPQGTNRGGGMQLERCVKNVKQIPTGYGDKGGECSLIGVICTRMHPKASGMRGGMSYETNYWSKRKCSTCVRRLDISIVFHFCVYTVRLCHIHWILWHRGMPLVVVFVEAYEWASRDSTHTCACVGRWPTDNSVSAS